MCRNCNLHRNSTMASRHACLDQNGEAVISERTYATAGAGAQHAEAVRVCRGGVVPLPLILLPAGPAVPPAVCQIGLHQPAAPPLRPQRGVPLDCHPSEKHVNLGALYSLKFRAALDVQSFVCSLPLEFDANAASELRTQPCAAGALQGGTRAAPRQLNDQNREESQNYWATSEACDYFVGLSPPADSASRGVSAPTLLCMSSASQSRSLPSLPRWLNFGPVHCAEGGASFDTADWTAIASEPFLEKDASPALGRAFLLPWKAARPNVMVQYSMWRRTPAASSGHRTDSPV